MNIQAYQRVTQRIVSLMEQGTVPWHQPWSITTGLPRNFLTQRPYRGINTFILRALNYESPHWLTLRQANQLGGAIRQGEKSCPVVFWKTMKLEDEQTETTRKIPMLRLYHVFNITQCEGLKNVTKAEETNYIVTIPAEIVAGMPQPPAIKHGMTQAYYSPSNDTVGMPERKRFETEERYHAALFHELIHSTGHEKRLKRLSILERNGFGSDPYCKEELIAELGSAYLCAQAGVMERTIDSSAAYIEGWLGRLKSDQTFLVYAAAQAQKAADYILGHRPEGEAL